MRFDTIQGDLDDPIELTVGDPNTDPVGPLALATSLTFTMAQAWGTKRITGTAIKDDDFTCHYNWQTGDTDTPGVYRAQVTANTPAGPSTFPKGDVLYVVIAPRL